MPLVPTRPRTCPGLGTGNLKLQFKTISIYNKRKWRWAEKERKENYKIFQEKHHRTNLCNLKVLGPYQWVVSLSKSLGKLMIWIASNRHFCIRRSHVQLQSYSIFYSTSKQTHTQIWYQSKITYLDTDTTTNAQLLTDESNLWGRSNLNT